MAGKASLYLPLTIPRYKRLMNMDFDMEARLAAQFAASVGNHASQQLDWHGLRARLAAAHAARSLLNGATPRESMADGGSFDRASAQALSGYGTGMGRGLDGVNPTALANGNSTSDIDAGVAGACSAGG
jgi:hypothetical protein